ncbi:MAG TPA: metallopeptidase TldD-related protein, partial [Bryobacteraceae bacterium]|nr:metallopeptidase TldD-related protein [Bryobacteraceae bacterium]
NSNYVFSDGGSRGGELTLDNDYSVLRRNFWLVTDNAFKNAVEAITRKRAALKNISEPEALADLWPAKPVQHIQPIVRASVSADAWTHRVRDLSRVFASHPDVLSSGVNFESSDAMFYLVNSEGSAIRVPDRISTLQVRAAGQAKDGMSLRDSLVFPVLDPGNLPSDADLRKQVEAVAQNIKAVSQAPVGETYSGPVLFEGVAGAQIMAEVLGPQFALTRRPIAEPGRPAPFLPSEFEGRIGSRVLPDFMDVVDDPTQKAWNGIPLLGFYEHDYEGVPPTPLTLVEGGKLKNVLLTRQPVRGSFEASNGRARVPGSFGANAASITNLFVKATETVKKEELRARLLKIVQDRGKPYGVIVRKMDFPTTAPNDELRRRFMSAQQGGGARPVSTPLHVYRVYPDGKEELVRGLILRAFSVRTLRDIVAVSDESFAFHYMNTLAPMSMGGTGYVAPTSVVAPSLLFDDVELERPQDDLPKLPIVPAPPLSATAR